MPHAVNHAASGTDGRKLYIFGGRDGSMNFVYDGYDYVQIYDPMTNTWEVSTDVNTENVIPSLPTRRGGTGKAVFFNGEFYVMGGETVTVSGATSNKVFANVDIYSPSKRRWRSGPPMPTPRHGIFPVMRGNKIFVAGGGHKKGSSVSDAFEFLQLI